MQDSKMYLYKIIYFVISILQRAVRRRKFIRSAYL